MADQARRKPIEDVSEISAITYGFMASKALFAALEFDLFTHIARGADSSGALAKVSGIAENRLIALLTALKSLGLIGEASAAQPEFNIGRRCGNQGGQFAQAL